MLIAVRESMTQRRGPKLPYDAEVEWLGTTARGAIINTGVRAVPQTRIETRFYVADRTTSWQSVFGGDQNTDGSIPGATLNCSLYRNGSGRFAMATNYANTGNWISAPGYPVWDVGWYDFVLSLDKGFAVLNGKEGYFTAPTSGRGRYPMLLFSKWRFVSADPSFDWIKAANTSGAYCKFIGRVAYFRVYKSDVLVLDLTPVRKAGVGYMYDRVSGLLLGNVGTGAFVYGTDVAGGGGGINV